MLEEWHLRKPERRRIVVRISERLEKLNQHLHNVVFQQIHPWQFTDINILDLSGGEDLRQEPIPVRKAYAQIYAAEHLHIKIREGELLIGTPAMSSVDFGTSCIGYLTKEESSYFNKRGLTEGSVPGHHPPRWEHILSKGVKRLQIEIRARISKELDSESPVQERIDYLRGMLLSLNALIVFASRCESLAISKAVTTTDHKRRNELMRMAEICRRVPFYPAETFYEALQSYWLTYTVLCSDGAMLPLGRIDQIFGSFYENDILEGTLSEEFGQDLFGCFLLKCNELVTLQTRKMKRSPNYRTWGFRGETPADYKAFADQYYYHEDEPEDSEHNKFFGQELNNRMMTCVVGGVGIDGHDATNKLSYLTIELMNELKLLFPTVGARIDQETPESFFSLLGKVLRYGQGEPIIYNDEAIISKYDQLGIPREEIREYSSDGCWEVLIPGRTDFSYIRIYTLQCLEWVMNNGKTIKNGNMESIRTGTLDSFATFDVFYDAFKKQMEHQMFLSWSSYVAGMGNTALVAPDPLFSAISDDCIEKALDFLDDGARFQFRCFMICGFADTVDSLVTIKKLVFEEKALSLKDLNQALLDNFVGHETLRALIINKLPKYGNCDPYADALAIRLIDDFSKTIRKLRAMYDKFYVTGGIATFHMYALWGNMTAASANGRLAYDAIAPNYSPVPGADRGGPLLALASSLKPDLSELMTGTPVDISINAKDFKGKDGIRRIVNMIKGYYNHGGQIMSITSTSVEELTDAMVHPEKHANLRIRMGGLSAYFVQLVPEQQRKIIERFSV